jgi:hypothetical protein
MRLERGVMAQACRPRSRLACMPNNHRITLGDEVAQQNGLGVRGCTAQARVAIGSPSPGSSGSGTADSESAAAAHQVDETMQRALEQHSAKESWAAEGQRAMGIKRDAPAGNDNPWERAGRTRRL